MKLKNLKQRIRILAGLTGRNLDVNRLTASEMDCLQAQMIDEFNASNAVLNVRKAPAETYTPETMADDIKFILDEYYASTIATGPLAGYPNPTAAVEKMQEIASLVDALGTEL